MKIRMLALALLALTGVVMAASVPGLPGEDFEGNPTKMARELSRYRSEVVNDIVNMSSWANLIEYAPQATAAQKEDARKLQAALSFIEVRLGTTKVPLEIGGKGAGMDSLYEILRRMGS